jgi:hypothetical protein
MATYTKAFVRTGALLVALTLIGLVEAVFSDRLSPGGRVGLGVAGFQAVVIGWAALASTAGQASRRAAFGALAAFVAVAALGLLSFAVDGDLSAGGVRTDGTVERWSSVMALALLLAVIVVIAAVGIGVAARTYMRLPANRPMRYVWMLVAVGPILTSIQPDDVYASRPSTWSALPTLIPETLLSIAALVWLALLLRTARDRLNPTEAPGEVPRRLGRRGWPAASARANSSRPGAGR